MEPGQHALYRVEPRGVVKVFGVSSALGVRASMMGQVLNTTSQEHVVLSVFKKKNHYIKLCVPHYFGQDSQAVCVVCNSCNTVFWSACMIFFSPFCQAHSGFLV